MELKIDGDEDGFLACYVVLKVVASNSESEVEHAFMVNQKGAAVYYLLLEWKTASSPR